MNGLWTHGSHPYDKNNIEDQKLLEKWESKDSKYYKDAIKTWTIRDVLKRETAKLNNLNYLEIFGKEINEEYIFNLIDEKIKSDN